MPVDEPLFETAAKLPDWVFGEFCWSFTSGITIKLDFCTYASLKVYFLPNLIFELLAAEVEDVRHYIA